MPVAAGGGHRAILAAASGDGGGGGETGAVVGGRDKCRSFVHVCGDLLCVHIGE